MATLAAIPDFVSDEVDAFGLAKGRCFFIVLNVAKEVKEDKCSSPGRQIDIDDPLLSL